MIALVEPWSTVTRIINKHSSMMCTARLPTICVSMAATRCQYWWGVSDWFSSDQVSSDDHQMLVAEVGISDPMWEGWVSPAM